MHIGMVSCPVEGCIGVVSWRVEACLGVASWLGRMHKLGLWEHAHAWFPGLEACMGVGIVTVYSKLIFTDLRSLMHRCGFLA